jgi:hypothetical protein
MLSHGNHLSRQIVTITTASKVATAEITATIAWVQFRHSTEVASCLKFVMGAPHEHRKRHNRH